MIPVIPFRQCLPFPFPKNIHITFCFYSVKQMRGNTKSHIFYAIAFEFTSSAIAVNFLSASRSSSNVSANKSAAS